MQDFHLITVICLLMLLTVTIYGIVIFFITYCSYVEKYQNLRSRYYQLLNRDLPLFYSAYFIKQEAWRQTLKLKPTQLTALYRLAFKNPLLAQKISNKSILFTSNRHKAEWLLLSAELNLINHNFNRCYEQLQAIANPRVLPLPLQAKYLYLTARYELYQTDMKNAADHLSRAIKIYKKKNYDAYHYEYAQCVSAMAQIYRISGVHDAAFSLFHEAQKIYENLHIPAKEIEIKAYLGILEIGTENFELAESYLTAAHQQASLLKYFQTEADIENWLGLTAFIKKDYNVAEQFLLSSLRHNTNIHTKAFTSEMLARLYYVTDQQAQALKFIKLALTHHAKQNNLIGIFENQYLRAEIYFNNQDYDKSKRLLNSLIKQYRYNSSCLDLANAYTLMGVIEFKLNHLDTARTLFYQALDLEHSKDCTKGAAVDYNNLAEIARRTKDIKIMKQYLTQALQYATDANDSELISFIEAKLKS